MFISKKAFFAIIFLIATGSCFGQLQLTTQSNAQLLAQKLVGDGITISNVTLTGSPLATGYFYNQGGTQIGLDSGIVLSTGRLIASSNGPGMSGPQSQMASTNLGTNGDAQLTALLNNQTTNDAAVLEFDFVPAGDSVRFRYVFSSEEYPLYTCSQWNDVFAFFISGPGITGAKNMALVPGTNIPVAINSVNSGSSPSGATGLCTAMGAGSPFTQYYVDNTGNNFFSYNGHTTIFVASSKVQPCQTYHLKIAIADVIDYILDSGVFLEAKSLTSDPLSIFGATQLSNGVPYLVEGCQQGGIKIVRPRKSSIPQTVNLFFGGTAINGTDVQQIPATAVIPANDSVVFVPIVAVQDNISEPSEFLKIYVSSGCTQASQAQYLDSIEIEIKEYDTLTLTPHDSAGICRNTPSQLSATATFNSYQWLPATGLNNPSIYNPLATLGSGTATYTCIATIGTCHAKDSVKLKVRDLDFLWRQDVNCKNGTTGEIRVQGGWEWKRPALYSINGGAYGPDSTFSNLTPGPYTVRIRDASGCIDSMTINVLQTFPDLVIADSIVAAGCNGNSGQLFGTGSGGLSPYQYSIDGVNYTATNNFTGPTGNYVLSVKDANGCVSTKNVVIGKDAPMTVTVTASGASCSGNADGVVKAHATGGSGLYQYSIDGINYQPVDSFLVSVGNFTMYVKDNKGCSASVPVNIPLNQSVYVNAGNDTTICEGQSIHFQPSSTGAQFTWVPDPSLSSTSIADPVASPVVTTTYYVTAVNGICSYKDTITINVWPAPLANAGPDSSICIGRTINLTGSGGVAYAWEPQLLVSDPSLPNPTIRPLQRTTFLLKVKSPEGCWSLKADSVQIGLVPAVKAFAGRDTVVAINQALQLHGVDLGNSGVTVYNWTPSFGLNNPDISNPIATLDRDMSYTLTLTTPEGCVGTDQITIKAYKGPEIYVPSGFTPNGDGKNDLLHVITVGMKTFHYFRIYNRWGQLVFATSNDKKGWDGTINGAKQGTGTFIWMAEMIDFNGKVVTRQGSTNLIR